MREPGRLSWSRTNREDAQEERHGTTTHVANGLLGVIGFTLSALFSLSAQAGIISLVGHLDPVPGADKYADVWGEGDYAYVGGWNNPTVLIIDISDPANPSLVAEYDP